MFEHTITVGLDHVPLSFGIVKKIVGDDYQNFEYVQRKTGAVLEVVGRGSDEEDPDTGKPSEKPLRIIIRHIDESELEVTKELLDSLVKNVQDEFKDFQPPTSVEDKKIFCPYCNMHTVTELYEMHCKGGLHVQRVRAWKKKHGEGELAATQDAITMGLHRDTAAAAARPAQVPAPTPDSHTAAPPTVSRSPKKNLDTNNIVQILAKIAPSFSSASQATTSTTSSFRQADTTYSEKKTVVPPWYSPPGREKIASSEKNISPDYDSYRRTSSSQKRSLSPVDRRQSERSEMAPVNKYSRYSPEYEDRRSYEMDRERGRSHIDASDISSDRTRSYHSAREDTRSYSSVQEDTRSYSSAREDTRSYSDEPHIRRDEKRSFDGRSDVSSSGRDPARYPYPDHYSGREMSPHRSPDHYSGREKLPSHNGLSSTSRVESPDRHSIRMKTPPWEKNKSRSPVSSSWPSSSSARHRQSPSPPPRRHSPSPLRHAHSPSPSHHTRLMSGRESSQPVPSGSSIWPPSSSLLNKLDNVYRTQISSDNLRRLHQAATGKVPLSASAADNQLKQTNHFCKLCWKKVDVMTDHCAAQEHSMMYLRLQINLGLKKFAETFAEVPFIGMDTHGGKRLAVVAIESLTREVLPEHRIEGDRFSEALILTGNLANYKCYICETAHKHVNKFVAHVSSEEHFKASMQLLAEGKEMDVENVIWPSPDVIKRCLLEGRNKPVMAPKGAAKSSQSILKYPPSGADEPMDYWSEAPVVNPAGPSLPLYNMGPTIAPPPALQTHLPQWSQPAPSIPKHPLLASPVRPSLPQRAMGDGLLPTPVEPPLYPDYQQPAESTTSPYVQSAVTTQALKELSKVCEKGGPGPDFEKMQEILIRSGYAYSSGYKQRIYGGTNPPGWIGQKPEGVGHEVFFKNSPSNVFEDELIPLFETCGPLWSFRLIIDPETSGARGFGFLIYLNKDDAARAVAQLDGYEIRVGKFIHVQFKMDKSSNASAASTTTGSIDVSALTGFASNLVGASLAGGAVPESRPLLSLPPHAALPSMSAPMASVMYNVGGGTWQAQPNAAESSFHAPMPSRSVQQDSDTKLPYWEKIKALIDRTGYHHSVTPVERAYGPPPNWNGEKPGAGHEIFIGNLPDLIFEDELVPLLEKAGPIYSVILVMADRTKIQPYNRGCCFVIYIKKEDADAAVQMLNGYEIRLGKHLRSNINLGKRGAVPASSSTSQQSSKTANPTSTQRDQGADRSSKKNPSQGKDKSSGSNQRTGRESSDQSQDKNKVSSSDRHADRGKNSHSRDRSKHEQEDTTVVDDDRPGPDPERMKELISRTGYSHTVTPKLRTYGGPPPGWNPNKPAPEQDCEVLLDSRTCGEDYLYHKTAEGTQFHTRIGGGLGQVFCKSIPTNIFEDELIPLFSKYGKIWSLRLGLDPSNGNTRGFCFCRYTERNSAENAVKKLDGYEIRMDKRLKCQINITLGHSSTEAKEEKSKPPAHDAKDKFGPNKAKLQEILDNTGYSHTVTLGMRVYGGPPPNWNGKKKPGRGHEVFCKGIPADIFEDELVPLFSKFGTIWSLRVMINVQTNANRGFCFIIYTEKVAADRAVNKLNGYEIRLNRLLKCNLNLEQCRLFVGNMPRHISREEIRREFRKFTDGLEDVEVTGAPDNPHQKNRGFAFLEYDSLKAATGAYNVLSSEPLYMWGKKLEVDWAAESFDENAEAVAKVKVLYISNLRTDVTQREILKEFEPFGEIEFVKQVHNAALIHFVHREDAVTAMDKLNGKKLLGYEMKVSLARPRIHHR